MPFKVRENRRSGNTGNEAPEWTKNRVLREARGRGASATQAKTPLAAAVSTMARALRRRVVVADVRRVSYGGKAARKRPRLRSGAHPPAKWRQR
jgi:hypothetical protein